MRPKARADIRKPVFFPIGKAYLVRKTVRIGSFIRRGTDWQEGLVGPACRAGPECGKVPSGSRDLLFAAGDPCGWPGLVLRSPGAASRGFGGPQPRPPLLRF